MGVDFCLAIVYIYVGQKKGGNRMSPRTGRPTTNPRPNKLSIRLNNESLETLEVYCEQKKVNKTEAIERAIGKLKDEIKK